ncbi:MAG: hypothetical protein ACI4DU_09140 [Lachnospiraceae bacterium]
MINFCTLFDSYYLDKGLCLYRSLEKVSGDFTLYIFCFDEKSQMVLNSMELRHAVILSNKDIEAEDSKLLELKQERSKAEYCWTCTSVIIEYVLKHYDVDHCIYIDADLYFFSNPQVLLDEIHEAGANVVITEHRFSDSWKDQRTMKRSGKYCVEFNYFDQSDNAKEALTWWKERCYEWCYHLYEPERMGDQKYLEKFPKLFQGVHELQHLGGGVAPWNLAQYEYVGEKPVNTGVQPVTGSISDTEEPADESSLSNMTEEPADESSSSNTTEQMTESVIYLREKKTGIEFPVVFYHFQNIRYLSEKKVNVSSETLSKPTKDALYRPYLKAIEACRRELLTYGVTFGVKKIYSSNKFIAFLQGTVLRFRIKSLSDIYDLEKL